MNEEFGERVTITCVRCSFVRGKNCTIPGGTCCYREIFGVPGRKVGDILEELGVIGRVGDATLLEEAADTVTEFVTLDELKADYEAHQGEEG